jgi:hypothetical protein
MAKLQVQQVEAEEESVMTFSTVEVDTLSRGVGPSVAIDFVAAIENTLQIPAYAESGFSISIEEFKSALGYLGSAKTPSIVWAINKHFENQKIAIRAGVRADGKRVSFRAWNGQKRVRTTKKAE